jgi:transposase-like protein
MKANIKSIRKKRLYSEEFKKRIVKEFETGKFSVPQIEKLHGIGNRLIYNWIYKYSTFNERGYRIMEIKKSSTSKIRDLQNRIKELERMVGQKQIKIDYYEKMIELAKEELNIDLKKNFDTPQSSGSGKTRKS